MTREIDFNLPDYWGGGSEWSQKELPLLFDSLCKSPLVNRIIIKGPIGVGKSRLARIFAAYIRLVRSSASDRERLLKAYQVGHKQYPQAGIPEDSLEDFKAINVATLPPQTGMVALFGVAPNYYSGVSGRPGIFEMVMYKNKENDFYNKYYQQDKMKRGSSIEHPDKIENGEKDYVTGGIVFLDEIADATIHHQTALLKLVAEGTFNREGCPVRTEIFDGIIIGATWKKLNKISEKDTDEKFRADLLSRFEGAVINIPPLSERPEDIAPHARQIAKEINLEIENRIKKIEEDRSLESSIFIEGIRKYHIAIDSDDYGSIKLIDIIGDLKNHDWKKGSVRELRRVIERYITFQGKKKIRDIIKDLKN